LTLVSVSSKTKRSWLATHWEDIQRKRIVTHSRRELTIDELLNVCQAATGELRVLLVLGIYSGLRLGDCATLRWGETDLRRGVIRRVPNKTGTPQSQAVIIPIHPILREMLTETPVNQRGEYVLPETATLYAGSVCAVTDRVQHHFKKCGIKLHKPGTGTDGKRAVVEVGFPLVAARVRFTLPRKQRAAGCVESIVGHSNPAMTRTTRTLANWPQAAPWPLYPL
jgi:integrase